MPADRRLDPACPGTRQIQETLNAYRRRKPKPSRLDLVTAGLVDGHFAICDRCRAYSQRPNPEAQKELEL